MIRLLQRLLPLPEQAAFWIVLLGLLLLGLLLSWFVAPRLTQDINALFTEAPAALNEFGTQLTHYGWAQDLIDRVPSVTQVMPSSGTLFTRITGTFSTVLNVLTNLVFILFVAIFLAANPAIYRRGIV